MRPIVTMVPIINSANSPPITMMYSVGDKRDDAHMVAVIVAIVVAVIVVIVVVAMGGGLDGVRSTDVVGGVGTIKIKIILPVNV